jgi:PAS domain S-box-containing protein
MAPLTDRFPLKPWPAYVFAIVATAATLGLRLALDAPLGQQPALVVFTVPIMLSAYAGGFKAGLLATVLSYFAASYYVLPPIHSFAVASGAERWQQFFVALAGVVISASNEALHRVRRRVESATRDYEHAQMALRMSEQRYRDLVEWAPEAMIVHSGEKVLFVNPAAVRMFGASASTDLVGKHILDLVHSDFHQIALARMKITTHSGEVTPMIEARLVRLDGTILKAETHSTTVVYEGKPAQLGSIRDVTERTRVREALRASEERYHSLFEHAPDGILIADPASNYIDANTSICRMLGYSRTELIGLRATDIVAETDIQYIDPALTEINAKSVHHRVWQLRRKDGSTFGAEVSVTQIPDGNLLAMIRDITEQKQAMESLRTTRELMAAIVDSTDDAIISKDLDGTITSWNTAAERMFGFSAAEIVGQSVRYLIPDGLQDEEDRVLSRIRRGERVERVETVRRRKDGALIPVSLTVSPIQDGDGTVIGASKIVRDISERRQAENERQRLVLLAQVKGEFLANMSHELRTPLNAIIGFAELMHRGKVGPVSAEHEEYLGDILTSSRHLLHLINDVLDLAKIESGKMEFRPESVNLATLTREVSDILRGLASSRHLQVSAHVDPEVATVIVDPARVKQILYNYLSNAIKFTPAGGQIAIRILPESPDFVRIDVEDTGVGIAPGDLDKLFVEFQQLDAGSAKEYQGTGLGLALTKKVAEAHGGRVAVRSAPGEGSTFSVILPRVMAMSQDDDLAGPLMNRPVSNRTILVVDDDPAALKIADFALREMGYRPVCSANPEDALRTVAADPPGVVIVDLLMPGVGGFEFVTRLRAMPAGRDLPIIVWTVKDLDENERRRLQPSITGIVSKDAGGSYALVQELRRLLPMKPFAPDTARGE